MENHEHLMVSGTVDQRKFNALNYNDGHEYHSNPKGNCCTITITLNLGGGTGEIDVHEAKQKHIK